MTVQKGKREYRVSLETGYRHEGGKDSGLRLYWREGLGVTEEQTVWQGTYEELAKALAPAPRPQPDQLRDDQIESQIQEEFLVAHANGSKWEFWLHRQLVIARKKLSGVPPTQDEPKLEQLEAIVIRLRSNVGLATDEENELFEDAVRDAYNIGMRAAQDELKAAHDLGFNEAEED